LNCAGEVAAMLVQAGDQAKLHWIAAAGEDNGNACCRRLCCKCRRSAAHRNHAYLTAYKVGGHFCQLIGPTLTPNDIRL
jgi:hypothetical protein